MRIIIDGQELEAAKVEGEDLESILLCLQQDHVSPNLITGVRINGEDFSEDVPHASVEVDRETIETLEVATRSGEEIAIHFIDNGDQIIDMLLDSLPHIVEIFRLGDETEANEHYLAFLESLHLLISMFDQIGRILHLDYDQTMAGEVALNQRMEKLSQVMDELLKIQEENDWIYLADLLEYEMAQELAGLKEALPGFRTNLN